MNNPLKRNFILGDNWLYYKIYSSKKTADEILVNGIKPVTEKLLFEKIIDKWFFIRYMDPEPHIRLRFHLNDPKDIIIIINELRLNLADLINEDFVWNINTDTYKREIERYGESTMELSECLFFYDSMMIVNFLNYLTTHNESEELRWLFALRAIDSYLNSFNYSKQDKLNLLKELKTSFSKEFGITKQFKKQIGRKYRDKKRIIEKILYTNIQETNEYSLILQYINSKEKHINNISIEIIRKLNNDKSELNINSLMASYIHMLMNRLFISKNRMNELVCYDFMFRFYTSDIVLRK